MPTAVVKEPLVQEYSPKPAKPQKKVWRLEDPDPSGSPDPVQTPTSVRKQKK